jgi:hypothetical protein
MNPSMSPAPETDPIPALVALGDQFDLAAARVVLERRRRPPASWPSVLAPALLVLIAVMGVSVRVSPPAEALVVRAADLTAASPTGRFTMSMRVDRGEAGGTAIDLSTEGVYDRSTGRLRTSVDLSRALGGGGAVPALPGFTGTVETIEDGSVVYLHAAVFEELLPEHTAWVRVDAAKLDRLSPLGPAAGLGGAPTDPASFLQALRGIGDDTHVVERATIDGVAMQHYRGTVDLARAADGLPSSERERLRDAFNQLGIDQDAVRIPMDVWVDDDGAVRRVTTEIRVAADATNDASLDGSTITVTVEYRDLGEPDTIELPDAGSVTDITPLVNAALGGPLSGK